MATVLKYDMGIVEARVEAAKLSRKEGKKVYIVVNEDGDCAVSFEPIKEATAAVYKNGSEIALDAVDETSTAPKERKGKKLSAEKVANSDSTTNNKTNTAMAKAAKKSNGKKSNTGKAATEAAHAGEIGKATTLFLTKPQWEKFWKALEKEGVSFRDFIKATALKKIGG